MAAAHRLQSMTRLLPLMRRNWLALLLVGAASYMPAKACPLSHFSLRAQIPSYRRAPMP